MLISRNICWFANTRSIRKFSSNAEKWDIYSSVSVERTPIISRDFTDLELRFHKLLQDIEFEKSHKSPFEVRLVGDKVRAKQFSEGTVSIAEMESFPKQTGQDFLDASIEELKSFKFGSKSGGDAVEKDTKSLKRALDRYLLLLVKEQIGQNEKWVLPQGKHIDGESLRDCAERIVKEKCGSHLQVKIMGNAPFGFYKYRYPRAVRKGESVGAKIFFYKAFHLKGQVELNNDSPLDFMWACRNELNVLPYDYLKSVQQFLIDEEH